MNLLYIFIKNFKTKNIKGNPKVTRWKKRIAFFQKNKCFFCFVDLNEQNISFDHYLPKNEINKFYSKYQVENGKSFAEAIDIYRDKINSYGNIVACCRKCNAMKSDAVPSVPIIEAKKIFYKRLKE